MAAFSEFSFAGGSTYMVKVPQKELTCQSTSPNKFQIHIFHYFIYLFYYTAYQNILLFTNLNFMLNSLWPICFYNFSLQCFLSSSDAFYSRSNKDFLFPVTIGSQKNSLETLHIYASDYTAKRHPYSTDLLRTAAYRK